MMVSIVVPALNEEKGIAATLDRIPLRELKDRDLEVEILVVDGGSEDHTREVAKMRQARVVVEPHVGYGRAYKVGFSEASGDIIVTLDADGAYPAEAIPHLVDLIVNRGFDFITTNRFASIEDGAITPVNRFGNRILSSILRLLFSIPIQDSQSGMWALRRTLLSRLQLISDGMSFSEEIKIRAFKAGKAIEVPISYQRRLGHRKLRIVRDGLSNLLHLLLFRMLHPKYSYMKRRSLVLNARSTTFREFYEREGLRVNRYGGAETWETRYHRQRFRHVINLLWQHGHKGSFVDVGCGTGEYLLASRKQSSFMVGLDISSSYLQRAVSKLSPEAMLILGSAEALPLRDKSFDIVLCSETLEHLVHPVEALEELFRVASKRVIITTPNFGLVRVLMRGLGMNLSALDQSVGHLHIFKTSQIIHACAKFAEKGWKLRTAKTLHLTPPMLDVALPLRASLVAFVSVAEAILNALLPMQGNIALFIWEDVIHE